MRRLMYVLALAFVLCACGDSQVTQLTPTPQPTTQPTTAPTQAVVTSQSTVAPVAGPALLGSEIGTFVAASGQPNDHSTISTGDYHFSRYSGSNTDRLIIQTDNTDGDPYTPRVQSITVQAPEASWSPTQAYTACSVYFPHDAIHKRRVTLTDGYDEVYFSSSLASRFPASAFSDGNGNAVQAGLFDVLYWLRDSSTLDSCGIQIGTQQMQ